MLYYLELGTAAQVSGSFKKSSEAFEKAYEEIRRQETISLSEKSMALTLAASFDSYHPIFYERYLLHSLNALNYLFLGEYDSARVEAVRSLQGIDRYETRYGRLPIVHFIAGLCYEYSDEMGDAYIEYKRAFEPDRRSNLLLPRLETMAHLLNRTQEAKEYGSLRAAKKLPPWQPGEEEFLLLVMTGRPPGKKPYFIPLSGPEKIEIPVFRQSVVQAAEINIGSSKKDVLLDLNDLVGGVNKEILKKESIEELTRLYTRKKIVKEAKKKYGETTGELVRLGLLSLAQGDYRSWQTLPCRFELFILPSVPELKGVQIVPRLQGKPGIGVIRLGYGR